MVSIRLCLPGSNNKPKAFLALALFLFACSSAGPRANSPLEAIDQIRELAGFPSSTLRYVETTTRVNSPTGDLQVDLYQDEEGRKFFVEPTTYTVVEIDARDTLVYLVAASNSLALSRAELERKAEEFVRSAVPEFSSRENNLSYEAGEKGDNLFFTWGVANTEIFFMPPFIQVGLKSSGDLFAFYNTLTIH